MNLPASHSHSKSRNNKSVSFIEQPSTIRHTSGLPTVNPETNGDQSQKIYKDIISINKDYFSSKTKVSSVKKPNKFQYKLPSRTGKSQYTQRYLQKNRSNHYENSSPIEQPGIRIQLPHQQITNFLSSYQNAFSLDKKRQPASAMNINKGVKPSFFLNNGIAQPQSSYQSQFASKELTPNKPAKRLQSMVIGGKFQGESNYQGTYKSKPYLKTEPPSPILQKQHKIFVGVKKPHHSRYQEQFLNRIGKVEEPLKPQSTILPSFQRMIEKSVYKRSFENPQAQKQVQFDCISGEQLDMFMMNN